MKGVIRGVFWVAALFGGVISWAQPHEMEMDSSAPEFAADSPRASLQAYFDAVSKGNYSEAAKFLDLRDRNHEDGSKFARNLKAIFDRKVKLDIEKTSSLSSGNLNDALASNLEEIGRIVSSDGSPGSILMRKLRDENGLRWVFTAPTVAKIPSWYSELSDRWALDVFPEPLLQNGPRDIRVWQWLALVLLGGVAWLLGKLMSWTTRKFLLRIVVKTEVTWDDALLPRLSGPLVLFWMAIVVYLLLPFVSLYPPAEQFIHSLLKALCVVALAWAVLRSIDVVAQGILSRPEALKNPSAKSLVPLGVRISKVIFFVFAMVALLSSFGVPVASLLAGLGIGGLAIALAGQKTVENLFGAFSLGLDQPIREGELVRVDGVLGTVESIGLRSTRLRTADRTMVSIPNGKISEMRLESYATRDRFRLFCEMPFTFQTKPSSLRDLIKTLQNLLDGQPSVWPKSSSVHIKEVGQSAIVLEVSAYFQSANLEEFSNLRDTVLLMLMEEVEKSDCHYAYPTQTVHLMQK